MHIITKNTAVCPQSIFICFVWCSQLAAITSIHRINQLVFITEMQHIYCQVQNDSLNIIQMNTMIQIVFFGVTIWWYGLSSMNLFSHAWLWQIIPLTPNDPYNGCTALLTSKCCILYIYSTNTGTEYFKHGIYSPFFFSSKCSMFHKSNVFGSCFIHILYTVRARI